MLSPILENDDEISSEGYSESLHPLTAENVPATVENAPKTDELDPTTGAAIKFSYRIFNGSDIRMALDESKQVWFVADDVCKVLGYKNTKDAINKHCGKVIDSNDMVEGETEMARKITVDTKGGKQAMIAISEPDLYRLIMRSRMPDARKFEKWVVEDVLPTIRRTGKYAVRRKIDYTPASQPEAAAPEVPDQCELFPNMMPSMTFPKPLTEKINEAKRRLFEHGTTFPNNKEFVKFLIAKALEDINSAA